jgi:hypothetical protein
MQSGLLTVVADIFDATPLYMALSVAEATMIVRVFFAWHVQCGGQAGAVA